MGSAIRGRVLGEPQLYTGTQNPVIQYTFWNITNPHPLHWGHVPISHAVQGISSVQHYSTHTDPWGWHVSGPWNISTWPSQDVYPGGPHMLFCWYSGAIHSWLWVGLSEGCVGGWAGRAVRVLWVGGTQDFCSLFFREVQKILFFSLTQRTCNIFCEYFFNFFSNFSNFFFLNFFNSFQLLGLLAIYKCMSLAQHG